jgi:hypothetical protein
MAYPTSPKPNYSYILTPVWNTAVTKFDTGKEQMRQKWAFAKYNVQMTYNVLSATNMQILYNHFMSTRGTMSAFNFYTLDTGTWGVNSPYLYVGYGDASSTIFDLPGKNTSSQSVYLNGASQGTGWSISAGTGVDSADRIIFSTAPPAGQIIAAGFSGYMRIRCRYAADNGFVREAFSASLTTVWYKITVNLQGLSPIA